MDLISHRHDEHIGLSMLFTFNLILKLILGRELKLNGLYNYHPKTGPKWWSPKQVIATITLLLLALLP